jgi:thioredoxin 1
MKTVPKLILNKFNKMRNLLIITAGITLMILIASGIAKAGNRTETDKGIQFYKGTWNEALAIARKENKIIFLDLSATWCGPCKFLKANTFTNNEVAEYYNANFINVELDGEKGDGAALVRKYEVKGYPALFFISPNGKVVKGTLGFQDVKEFLELGHSLTKK